MNKIIVILVSLFFVTYNCSTIRNALGTQKCTYGPSYWCSNITNAKSCNAVTHCIKSVWEKQAVPEDTDSICKICLDMVTQARDQLESNETQDELKQVFEGSCALIPIKIVKKECTHLVDDFIPELIEALASQMNPQVVCSTAGLCNNARIDKLLEQYEQEISGKETHCEKCNALSTNLASKFENLNRDDVLDQMLKICGTMSSLSDGCASIVLIHFNEIHDQIQNHLNNGKICSIAEGCTSELNNKDTIEIKTKSNFGYIKPTNLDSTNVNDDIPCELCQQLVQHLRDILVANTTELEFKQVMNGLCNQMKGFKAECLNLVDEYYKNIYETLVNDLDANGACFLIGVCPKSNQYPLEIPSNPLLPVHQNINNRRRLGENEPVYSKSEIIAAQLPIDKLMMSPFASSLIENGKFCPICNYFFHFLQEEISLPKNEDEIKDLVGKTCDKFPKKLAPECHQFIESYGDGIIALLVQEIDPRDICPTLKLCGNRIKDDVDVFASSSIKVTINENNLKSSCSLCKLVVQELKDYLRSNKNKEYVRSVLKQICNHLNPKLKSQCSDFVQSYADELIDKLVGDFTALEICVDIKQCTDSKGLTNVESDKDNEIYTNEIPDNTINGQPIVHIGNTKDLRSGECTLCTEVMQYAIADIDKTQSDDKIVQTILHECTRRSAYEDICDKFVNKNAQKIVDLLRKNMTPKQICSSLALCVKYTTAIIGNVYTATNAVSAEISSEKKAVSDTPQCVICEFIMTQLEKDLKDKTTQEEIMQAIRTVCSRLPNTISKKCINFIDQYANLIISLIDSFPPKEICQQMSVCATIKKNLIGGSECSWGPTHWCSNQEIAKQCGANEYCEKHKLAVW